MRKAPDFHLPDEHGVMHSLADYAGRWLVLYLYPEDDTPLCTVEACGFRDNYAQLQEAGLEVVGISRDSVASHERFAHKYGLNFTLLSDESKEVLEAYGAWGLKKSYGREFMGTRRKTFLINPRGEIVKEYARVISKVHPAQILEDFADINRV